MSCNEPVTLAFKSFESKSGIDETLAPIIFLHGLSSSKNHWEDVPQTTADRTKRKVYAIDARNHGDSPWSEYFSISLNVEDLFHFMDSRNIPKAVLVGHSLGGRTSIYAALRKPERVEKIFVEDMCLRKIDPKKVKFVFSIISLRKESIQHMPKGLSESEAVEFTSDYVRKQIPKESPVHGKLNDILKSRVELKRTADGGFDLACNVEVLLRRYRDNYETFYSEPKGQYQGPAYFIYGAESPVSVNTDEENIRKHFSNAELVEFPKAGHNIHVYFPHEFVETIINNL